jgi:hypothetical protein
VRPPNSNDEPVEKRTDEAWRPDGEDIVPEEAEHRLRQMHAGDAAVRRRIEILRADGLRIADHDGLDGRQV